jgi:hypothetical protein
MLEQTSSVAIETETARICDHCGGTFTPRAGSGGKPQRFCTNECKAAFHSQRLDAAPTLANVGNVKPTAPVESGDDFDWAKAECVVLREQPATAIYHNPYGALVIRQERAWNQEDDPFIFIAPQNIMSFIDSLCDIAGIPSVGKG